MDIGIELVELEISEIKPYTLDMYKGFFIVDSKPIDIDTIDEKTINEYKSNEYVFILPLIVGYVTKVKENDKIIYDQNSIRLMDYLPLVEQLNKTDDIKRVLVSNEEKRDVLDFVLERFEYFKTKINLLGLSG